MTIIAGAYRNEIEAVSNRVKWGNAANLTELRGLDKTKVGYCRTEGYTSAGDGGGAFYYLDAADTTTADDDFLCIVASDGGRWKLNHNGTILPKWAGAVGDGTTDDISALQKVVDSFVTNAVWLEGSLKNGSSRVIDLQGANFAISEPLKFGPMIEGNGAGILVGLRIKSGKFTALPGEWAAINEYVPSAMMLLVDHKNSDIDEFLINDIEFQDVIFDCDFNAGTAFLENTYSVKFVGCKIYNLAENTVGIDTSIGNPELNPRGYQTKNGALTIEDLVIDGVDPVSTTPTGDLATMGTIGVRQRTADFRHNNIIISGVTQSKVYAGAVNGQINNCHPWSREVYIDENCFHLMFVNCYWDYTDVKLHSFDHFFIGCHALAGVSSNYILYAQEANQKAKGLIIANNSFNGGQPGIVLNDNGYSWAADPEYTITGCSNRDGSAFNNNQGSTGQWVVGTRAARYLGGGVRDRLQVHSNDAKASATVVRWGDSGLGGVVSVGGTRAWTNAEPGTYVPILTGDVLGKYRFIGDDGAMFGIGAEIRAEAVIDWGTSPQSKMIFSTSGSDGRLDRWQILAGGDLVPGADNVYQAGRANLRAKEVYAAAGAINTSDAREKTFIEMEAAETAAATEIKASLRKFKFNAAMAEKGADGARLHFGASAQQVGEILTAHGLDPEKYAFFCYDEWDAEQAVYDEEGRLMRPAIEAGNRYGLRYEELLCFLMIAL